MKDWCEHYFSENGRKWFAMHEQSLVIANDFKDVNFCPICGKERPKVNHKQGEK